MIFHSFGNLAYSSATVTRNVKIVNVSSVSLYVSMHVFDKSPYIKESHPFNIVMELFKHQSQSQPDLDSVDVILSEDYYGKEISNYITVNQ